MKAKILVCITIILAIAKDDVKISMQKASHGVRCTALNTGIKKVYIPVKYNIRIAKDSLVMEPVVLPSKGDVTLSYNVFMPPKMNKLNAKDSFTFLVGFKRDLNLNKVNIYFKVYDQDYIQTLGSRKYSATAADFMKFDKVHSRLLLAAF